MYDAVVVGAGVSGLTNALILARAGKRVAVVERAAKIGSLLSGFDRWGVHFDTGFHYAGGMAAGEGVRRFFKFLNLDKHLDILPLRQHCFDRVIATDHSAQLELPVGEQPFIAALSAEFPAEHLAITRFVHDVLHVADNLPYMNLSAPVEGVSVFAVAEDVSLTAYLERLTTNIRLRQLLSLHCILHGVAAARVPFRFHASVVGPYIRSASTFAGGGLALVKAFEHELAACGVDIYCGQPVHKLCVSTENRVNGVELADGQVLKCSFAIGAIHPQQLLACLPPHLVRPVYRKRLQGVHETSSACLLFAHCKSSIDLLHGSNLYLWDVAQQQQQHFPFDNNMCYLTAANGVNSSGFMSIVPAYLEEFTPWADTVSGQRPAAYYTKKRGVAAEIIQRFTHSIAALHDQIDHCTLSSPLTLRDYMHSHNGALYGAQRVVDEYPLQATTRIEGLFLSGQALVAPGVMGAMISAFNSCGTILGRERLIGELKKCN
ncbi:MAG: NAD(P)/FAD-dependent oxidoreductase [Desulfuromonas sp.]|nr:NAD(P)/FAD-dependent oxidoreductase [Desulfuromonas sp.]